MSRRAKFRPIFLLAAAFVLLAPVSVATGLAISEPAKYVRLGTTVLMVLLGAQSGRGLRMGPVGTMMSVFVAFFVMSGIWSGNPVFALIYKGMFGLSFFAGLVLVNSVKDSDEFKKGLDLLGAVAVLASFVALAAYWRDPSGSVRQERMSVFGLNANLLGEASAMLWILCLYLALHQKSKLRLAILGLACASLALIIVGSGSRGAALMAAVGSLFLLVPFTKRPGMVAGVLLGILVVVYVGSEVLDVGGGRFVRDLSKDTRTQIWTNVMKRYFSKSPAIGIGWLNNGNQWAAVQSAYIQTLIESGIVGAGLLLAALASIANGFLRNRDEFQRRRLPKELFYLNLALLAPILMNGAFESSLFIGASLDSLLLGMGVGLLDNAVRIVATSSGPSLGAQRTVRPIATIPILPVPARPAPQNVRGLAPGLEHLY